MASELGDFLKSMGHFPLLTASEELVLGGQIQRWLHWEGGPEEAPRKVQLVGKRAKDRMVTANLRLVVSIAKGYRNKGIDMLDLVQEGTLGLIRAAEKFDPQKGYKFSTYATWWVRQGLTRTLQKMGSTIYLPGNVYNLSARALRTRSAFYSEHGRMPSIEELSVLVEYPAEKLKDLLANSFRAKKLYSLDEDGGDLGSFVADEKSLEDPLEKIDREMATSAMHDAIALLPDRQRELMEAQMLDGSLTALAKEQGITRQALHGRIERAQRSVRRHLEGGVTREVEETQKTICMHDIAFQLRQIDLLAA